MIFWKSNIVWSIIFPRKMHIAGADKLRLLGVIIGVKVRETMPAKMIGQVSQKSIILYSVSRNIRFLSLETPHRILKVTNNITGTVISAEPFK